LVVLAVSYTHLADAIVSGLAPGKPALAPITGISTSGSDATGRTV